MNRAKNDSQYCSSCLGMPICYLPSISVSLYMYINKSSHNVQNMVDGNYLALFTSLCCPHVAGFHLRENAVGEL
jgi:hypothetical protein